MLFRGVLVVGQLGGQQARAPLVCVVGQLMCGLGLFPHPPNKPAHSGRQGVAATAIATVVGNFR